LLALLEIPAKVPGADAGSLKLLLNPALKQIMIGLLKVEKNN
jgi:hypothetical protein